VIALLWSGSLILAFIAGVGANHVWKLLLRDVHDDDAPLFVGGAAE